MREKQKERQKKQNAWSCPEMQVTAAFIPHFELKSLHSHLENDSNDDEDGTIEYCEIC